MSKKHYAGQVLRNNFGRGDTLAVVTKVIEPVGFVNYLVIKGGTLPPGYVGNFPICNTPAWVEVPEGDAIVIREKPDASVGEFYRADNGTMYIVTDIIGHCAQVWGVCVSSATSATTIGKKFNIDVRSMHKIDAAVLEMWTEQAARTKLKCGFSVGDLVKGGSMRVMVTGDSPTGSGFFSGKVAETSRGSIFPVGHISHSWDASCFTLVERAQ